MSHTQVVGEEESAVRFPPSFSCCVIQAAAGIWKIKNASEKAFSITFFAELKLKVGFKTLPSKIKKKDPYTFVEAIKINQPY